MPAFNRFIKRVVAGDALAVRRTYPLEISQAMTAALLTITDPTLPDTAPPVLQLEISAASDSKGQITQDGSTGPVILAFNLTGAQTTLLYAAIAAHADPISLEYEIVLINATPTPPIDYRPEQGWINPRRSVTKGR